MDARILGLAIAYDPSEQGNLSADCYNVLRAIRDYCLSRVVLTEALRREVRRQLQGARMGIFVSAMRQFQRADMEKITGRSRRLNVDHVTYISPHRDLLQDAIAQGADIVVTELSPWLDKQSQIQEEHNISILTPRDALRRINELRGMQ